MVDNDGHSAVPANRNAEVEMRQRLRVEGVVVFDDAYDILVRGRQKQFMRSHFHERKVAQTLLEYLHVKTTGLCTRTSTLAFSPRHISLKYASEVVKDLYQTRSELRTQKEEIERFKNVMGFC